MESPFEMSFVIPHFAQTGPGLHNYYIPRRGLRESKLVNSNYQHEQYNRSTFCDMSIAALGVWCRLKQQKGRLPK
mgnify:CR=1 FL=1